MTKVRRCTLRYEVWDEEEKRWKERFKSINPFKKRRPKPVSLGEREIWNLSEEIVKGLKKAP